MQQKIMTLLHSILKDIKTDDLILNIVVNSAIALTSQKVKNDDKSDAFILACVILSLKTYIDIDLNNEDISNVKVGDISITSKSHQEFSSKLSKVYDGLIASLSDANSFWSVKI